VTTGLEDKGSDAKDGSDRESNAEDRAYSIYYNN
jgi:hypothetical protein